MRAVMSNELRKILRDPQGRRELQKGMSKLDANKGTEIITVGGHQYQIQFMPAASKIK